MSRLINCQQFMLEQPLLSLRHNVLHRRKCSPKFNCTACRDTASPQVCSDPQNYQPVMGTTKNNCLPPSICTSTRPAWKYSSLSFFIPFILPITFSPPLMGSVTQPQWRLHQCSCWQIRVNLRMLLPNYWTTAQWDPFDPAPCLTGGHEQEKAVSIRMKREMKRIQTYTMLYQIKKCVCLCMLGIYMYIIYKLGAGWWKP